MNWYLQNTENSDVVISTRIRLARNLKNIKFNLNNKEEILELENLVKNNLCNLGYGLKFFRLRNMDDITKMSLVEKNILSPDFVLKRNETGSILINDDENICIMIGEEDHLRLQVFSAGLDLENTLNLSIEIDERIAEILPYSITEKYGYLTSCMTNVGTGLRASVMLHLPALTKTNNIEKVLESVQKFGLNIRGIYGENTQVAGDMYQISNKQTLGISEKEIVQNLKIIVTKIIDQEKIARAMLTKDNIHIEDMVYRSFGILSNCRKITHNETQDILSNIKLGTDLGIVDKLDDLKVKKLYLYTKPSNLQKYLGEEYEGIERDIKRAEIIKNIINE